MGSRKALTESVRSWIAVSEGWAGRADARNEQATTRQYPREIKTTAGDGIIITGDRAI